MSHAQRENQLGVRVGGYILGTITVAGSFLSVGAIIAFLTVGSFPVGVEWMVPPLTLATFFYIVEIIMSETVKR